MSSEQVQSPGAFWRNRAGDLRVIWSALILLFAIAFVANPLVIALDAVDIPVVENSLKNACVAIAVSVGLLIVIRLSSYQAADFGVAFDYWPRGIVIGFAAGTLPICIYVLIGEFVGELAIARSPSTSFENTPLSLALFGQGVRYLGGSIFEESVTRGFLFYALLTRLPFQNTRLLVAMTLFLSSLLFSVLHVGNEELTIVAYLNLLLAGIWFGIVYLSTGNLIAPVVAHFAWNFFQNNVFGMPNGGQESRAWLFSVEVVSDASFFGGSLGPEGSFLITGLLIVFIGAMRPWRLSRASSPNRILPLIGPTQSN